MQTIVDTYLRHVADHATKDALACLEPGFTIEFAGAGFELTREQTALALEWDAGANGRLDWHVVEEGPSSVTIEGSEGNEFLDLIGIESLDFRSVYTVGMTGLISRQLHEVFWGPVSLADALAPLLAWAAEHEAGELDDIYPGGQMSYSGPMAVRWVRLARRWRSTTLDDEYSDNDLDDLGRWFDEGGAGFRFI